MIASRWVGCDPRTCNGGGCGTGDVGGRRSRTPRRTDRLTLFADRVGVDADGDFVGSLRVGLRHDGYDREISFTKLSSDVLVHEVNTRRNFSNMLRKKENEPTKT